MKKDKLQKYIDISNKIHDFKYDYSKITEIKNVKSPITIICPIHGEFNTNFDNHINHKTSCPYCKGVGKKSEKDFIEECKKIHSDKNYDFSLVKYVNCKTKVKVICHNKNILGEEHGVFEIKPTHLINGHGCPKCSNRYMTTEEWIAKANKIHNFKYDYSLIKKYPNKQKEKGKFICHEIDDDGNEHGIFEMTYGSHIMGCGCPKCNGGVKSNKETFVKKANKIHNNYYSYDNFIYLNAKSKSYITCPIHGDFLQNADQHLRGQGCPKCNSSKLEKTLISLFNDNNIKYDYQVRFNDTKQTIDFFLPLKNLYIECQGEQHYIPISFGGSDDYETCLKVLEERKQLDYEKYNWVASNGFNIVYFTMPENFNDKTIDIFSGFYEDKNVFTNINDLKLYIDDLSDVIKVNNTNLEERKENFIKKANEDYEKFKNDIILKYSNNDKNINFEFNNNESNTEWFGGKNMNYHLNKTNECNEQGIKLLQIFEDEYIFHKEIVLNKIYHILGIDLGLSKIMGRKCKIIEIDNKIAETFLNEYHIQGFANSTVYLGCFYESNLVGVMTFKKENKNGYWELNRFASDYHYICQGIGGKLFKYFIKKYNPIEIKSFADRRWTLDKDDNLYTKLGFKLNEILKPNYTYYNPKIDKYKRFHKFNFRKKILHKKYDLPLSMSESEMVKELGYDRIWDCGLFKFIWRKN